MHVEKWTITNALPLEKMERRYPTSQGELGTSKATAGLDNLSWQTPSAVLWCRLCGVVGLISGDGAGAWCLLAGQAATGEHTMVSSSPAPNLGIERKTLMCIMRVILLQPRVIETCLSSRMMLNDVLLPTDLHHI